MQSASSNDILIVIIIGTLAILMIISFIVLFVLTHQKKVLEQKNILTARESDFQKNLVNASLLAAEEERMRLASNLHDDAGVLITSTKHKIQLAARTITDEKSKLLLKESAGLLDSANDVVRNITRELAPGAISVNGLINALKELCSKLHTQNLPVEFDSNGEDIKFEIQKAVNIYRMVSEVLNNLIKHASPRQIRVLTEKNSSQFIINIVHNGKAMNNDEMKVLTENSKGLGLKNIAARAQLTNSRIDYIPGHDFSSVSIKISI